MNNNFNGLGMHLGKLSQLSGAQTRSISAENFSGAKGEGGKATEGTGAGPARGLGQGWKVSPSINIGAQETVTLADITGPGALQHIWLTVAPEHWRQLVLRFYWDDENTPSVEVPVGDFSPMAGAAAATSARCRSPSTRRAALTATGRCPSESTRALRWRTLVPTRCAAFTTRSTTP